MEPSQPPNDTRVNLLRRNAEEVYVCQLDDPSGLEQWVANPAQRDPCHPSSNWCAICCARMILRAEGCDNAPTREQLFDWAVECHAYREIRVEGILAGWHGALHQHFAAFLGNKLGLWAEAVRHIDLDEIKARLLAGYYVLASVHPNIRFPHRDDTPEKKTGHLVVIYGFETEDGVARFTIMNSAGFVTEQSQIAVPISEHRLRQLFSGNAIVVGSGTCIEPDHHPKPPPW